MKDLFLKKADECLPSIYITEVHPDCAPTVLHTGDSLVLDLGTHYVGRLTFTMWHVDEYIDAPVKLAVRFCEVREELNDDYSTYNGWLCSSWRQEEIIHVDFPGEYRMPRRYAARFVRITVLATPKPLRLSNFVFSAESSADEHTLRPLPPTEPILRRIDEVAVRTLKNCMQRVFEDGPKRDRRLWIGDLRLEALANYYTFGCTDIVKRCLYLFAASERDNLGFLSGFVYENPIFFSGNWHLQDYSLMFVASLCDYYTHTKDEDTLRDLLPTAKDILSAVDQLTDERGIAVGTDVFIDWCEGLEKTAAFHSVYLYTLDLFCSTLQLFGEDAEAKLYRDRLINGRTAAYQHLFDAASGTVKNAYDHDQSSVHATAWMILGGVITGEEARRTITTAMQDEHSLKPFTPYMHHYTVEALLKAGLTDDAISHIKNIWGGMVDLGADTFFEAYVPGSPSFSPYGDRQVNSMCHAWSCTPTYFIRKYGFGRL